MTAPRPSEDLRKVASPSPERSRDPGAMRPGLPPGRKEALNSRPTATMTVDREGGIAAARMTTDFDTKRTENWIAVRSRDEAEKVNAHTAQRIDEIGAKDAFAEARNVRAAQGGMSNATALFAWAAKEALQQAPDRDLRMVDVSGGSCDVCAPYQGTWSIAGLDSWPPYHPHCECLAEVG